jgi:hypothetical protein
MSGEFGASAVTLANTVIGSGVFQGARTTGTSQTSNNNAAGGDLVLPFNASKSNSLYGASDTVQPKTLRSYFLIRYA